MGRGLNENGQIEPRKLEKTTHNNSAQQQRISRRTRRNIFIKKKKKIETYGQNICASASSFKYTVEMKIIWGVIREKKMKQLRGSCGERNYQDSSGEITDESFTIAFLFILI